MARRGGDKIFQRDKEKKKSDFIRKTNDKKTVPDIIIACEDSVSSPTYFQMIVSSLIENKIITQDSFVIAPNKHSNPTGVLSDLKNYKKDGKTYKDFDHKWIVIDRDIEIINKKGNVGGHTKNNFNTALKNAKNKNSKYNIEVAYTNDSFELWYLLHFKYQNSAINRDKIVTEVIKQLKARDTYKFSKLTKKNIKQENYTKYIFEALKPLQSVAISNAKKLLESYGEGHNPESDNPSTRVHLLVEVLNSIGVKKK